MKHLDSLLAFALQLPLRPFRRAGVGLVLCTFLISWLQLWRIRLPKYGIHGCLSMYLREDVCDCRVLKLRSSGRIVRHR